jgi:CheY-like chemotaxis protein
MPQGAQQGRIVVAAPGRDGATDALVGLLARSAAALEPPAEVALVTTDEPVADLTGPGIELVVVDARGPTEGWRAVADRLADRAPEVPVLLVASAGSSEDVAKALEGLPRADILRLPCADAEARARLRALTAAGRAREDERRRLATAIHDDALQVLSSVAMRLQVLRRSDAAGHQPGLDEMIVDLGAALERLRTLELDRRGDEPAGEETPAVGPDGADRSPPGGAPFALWTTPDTLRRLGHDLRSPLNAVLGFAQLLDLADLEPDQRDAVAQILQAGTRLVDLINDVIELTRIEAGIVEFAPRPLVPADQVRTVLAGARPAADAGRVTLVPPEAGAGPRSIPAGATAPRLLADPDRVTQILAAMVGHAVHAARPGERVTVSVSGAPAPGRGAPAGDVVDAAGVVRLAVHHDGPVPDPGDLPRLLVPFARPAPNPGTPGPRALALPIAAALARRMGGRLTAEAADGGTTLTLELPAGADRAPGGGDDDRPLFEVLYIEDNPSSMRLVERVLHQRSGVAMIAAGDGRTGMDLARRRHPALVLVDLHLPDMTGTDVLRALTSDPDTCDIPVVAISAGGRRDQDERLRAEGARAYLTKPFEIEDLLGLVDTIREEADARRPGGPGPHAEPAGLVARPGTSVVSSSDVAVAEERR